jgi:UDP-GlcNAc:undecaprenyl-phosphate GlcNAc-1-phosphate transferase
MLLVILGLSFCLTVVLTPVARRCAFRWGLVDQPDGRRKIHAGPIPLAGGLVILAAATGALLPVLLVPNPFQDQLIEQGPMLLGLFLSAVTLCGVGLADDFLGLHGRHKLLGQLAAISIVLASGLLVRKLRLFHWEVELGLLALPFTVCWLLGSINSLNLIDGMDGLLSCMGLIISLAMALMAAVAGQWVAACTAVALAGALIGFLFLALRVFEWVICGSAGR